MVHISMACVNLPMNLTRYLNSASNVTTMHVFSLEHKFSLDSPNLLPPLMLGNSTPYTGKYTKASASTLLSFLTSSVSFECY